MRRPTYTCTFCGQEFWHEPTATLRILPDHLESSACRKARWRQHLRTWAGSVSRAARASLFGRPAERTEWVVRVPMERVPMSEAGPIDLLAPAFEEQLTGTGGGFPSAPLRWRRTSLDRLRAAVDTELIRARQRGLKPELPVDYDDLRRWSRCRVAYGLDGHGGQPAQGVEEITLMMVQR
ncbi:MAG: hypothetical protein IT306_26700 [Chloroflexi bacterium]|nr:hypothetical protein [Chloroflexota bacterium]